MIWFLLSTWVTLYGTAYTEIERSFTNETDCMQAKQILEHGSMPSETIQKVWIFTCIEMAKE